MPERKSILSFVVLGIVLAPGTALAVDECLNKPNAPAPKGQHWYYRIDRANNNRQCWRLGPEGLRVQKIEPQNQKPKPQASAQPEAPRSSRPTTTGMAIASADTSADATAGIAPATGWLDVTKFPASSSPSQPVVNSQSVEATQSTATTDPEQPVPDRVTASEENPSLATPDNVQQPQHPALPQTLAASVQPAAEDDHTLALLTIMFVFLVIAGPLVHYSERRRRRRREAKSFQPPRWAPAVMLNTAPASAPVPLESDRQIGKGVLPPPLRSSDQTERLSNALQQLLDKLQAELNLEHGTNASGRKTETGMTSRCR